MNGDAMNDTLLFIEKHINTRRMGWFQHVKRRDVRRETYGDQREPEQREEQRSWKDQTRTDMKKMGGGFRNVKYKVVNRENRNVMV